MKWKEARQKRRISPSNCSYGVTIQYDEFDSSLNREAFSGTTGGKMAETRSVPGTGFRRGKRIAERKGAQAPGRGSNSKAEISALLSPYKLLFDGDATVCSCRLKKVT